MRLINSDPIKKLSELQIILYIYIESLGLKM